MDGHSKLAKERAGKLFWLSVKPCFGELSIRPRFPTKTTAISPVVVILLIASNTCLKTLPIILLLITNISS